MVLVVVVIQTHLLRSERVSMGSGVTTDRLVDAVRRRSRTRGGAMAAAVEESGSTNQEAEKRRTSENEWTAAAPLLRRGLQLHHRRVATRRLGGHTDGRELP